MVTNTMSTSAHLLSKVPKLWFFPAEQRHGVPLIAKTPTSATTTGTRQCFTGINIETYIYTYTVNVYIYMYITYTWFQQHVWGDSLQNLRCYIEFWSARLWKSNLSCSMISTTMKFTLYWTVSNCFTFFSCWCFIRSLEAISTLKFREILISIIGLDWYINITSDTFLLKPSIRLACWFEFVLK